jgi:membrane fusion protein (multidrug efflux system)
MLKRFAIMLAAIIVIVAVIGFLKFRQIQAGMAMGAKFAPAPAAVSTFKVGRQQWQPTLTAVGTANAVQGVMVSTDLPGIVREISFQSGTSVEKGRELVRLDTTQEVAQLNAAKSRQDLAKVNLDRILGLLKKRVGSQSDYDAADAEFKQATAATAEVDALIERKTIRAPFAGMLGIREVDLGQYLKSGDSVVPLQALDPIYVDFSLPQQALGQLEPGRTVEVSADGLPGENFSGKITAIDPNVDASTRNVRVQATLQNPDGKLRSGMFVNAAVLLPVRDEVLAIPASAIDYAPYGNSVFVVETITPEPGEDGTQAETFLGVRQQFVKLGTSRGDLIEVTKGLEPGQEVVSSGTFKVKDRAPVNVNNEIQPGAEAAPTVTES